MKRLTDTDVETAIANAVGAAEIELSQVFSDGLESEITVNFSYQLATAIQSLLMGRPVVIGAEHVCAALPSLVEQAPLGIVHPDAERLDSAVSPGESVRGPRGPVRSVH